MKAEQLVIRPEAQAAAHWWAQAIKSPEQDAGDLKLNAVIGLLGLPSEVTTEQSETFERELARRLEVKLAKGPWQTGNPSWGSYSRCISVDYDPGAILNESAEAAGINVRYCSTFPVKTNMWIDPGSVTVSCGYGAATVRVYPIAEAVDGPL